MYGYNYDWLDSLIGTYGSYQATMRSAASSGTSIALSFPNTGGITHRLTITTSIVHPVVKVKATCGGLSHTISEPSITFS